MIIYFSRQNIWVNTGELIRPLEDQEEQHQHLAGCGPTTLTHELLFQYQFKKNLQLPTSPIL